MMQKLYSMRCKHGKCNRFFYSLRKNSMYCSEHRKTKYRNERSKKSLNEDLNRYISYKGMVKETIGVCEYCGGEFQFKLFPSVKPQPYPKYCEKHRNSFKRGE